MLQALAERHSTLAAPANAAALLLWFCLVLFLLCFPDGRFVPGWSKAVALVWLSAMLITLIVTGTSLLPPSGAFTGALVLGGICAGVVAQLYRYRRVSDGEQREQTKWVVCGVTAAILGQIVFALVPWSSWALRDVDARYDPVSVTAVTLSYLFIPLCLGVAILRYQLWDIRVVVNRALVYGALTGVLVGVYTLLVGGLGALFQARGNLVVSLLATGFVAVLFAPLRDRLQSAVNRFFYGGRDDPYALLSGLGRRLEATLSPDAIPRVIVETVHRELKLPYVAITLREEETFTLAAAAGQPPLDQDLHRLPLTYQSELVGELLLAPRRPGEAFTPRDLRLLADLARQIGVAVHAVRLAADLHHSRERLVVTREEERRRLRNDLHDGLGPLLSGLTLKLETVRAAVAHDPPTATLLADLTARTRVAVADIRRLVYALRPPALDELGLVSALREAARQEDNPGAGALTITVDALEPPPPLPAAVEVAAYWIAREALTNVTRHAGTSACTVKLTFDDAALCLEISDNGRGLIPARSPGVGLASMRERAAELSGTCRIEPLPTGGTRVVARLPLAAHPRAARDA